MINYLPFKPPAPLRSRRGCVTVRPTTVVVVVDDDIVLHTRPKKWPFLPVRPQNGPIVYIVPRLVVQNRGSKKNYYCRHHSKKWILDAPPKYTTGPIVCDVPVPSYPTYPDRNSSSSNSNPSLSSSLP